ncbi:hypothetical protein MATR_32880 [Marivirga tractuosa]|nr:hypothetical protein MATR_32880 [Marivirga tractuosa]
MNLTTNVNDKLIVGSNTSIGFSQSSLIESENSVSLANPFAAVYLANPYEELRDSETGELLTGSGRTGANAYDRIVNSTNDRNELKGVFGAFAEYNIIDGLTAKAQIGVDYRQRDFERWIDPTSFTGGNVAPGNAGLLSNAFNRRLQWINTNTLSYTKRFNSVHDVDVVLGSEALQRTFNSFSSTGYGLNSKLPLSNQAITTGPNLIPALGGSWSRNSLFSLFSIFSYTYDGKYNFRGTLRRDASSRFGVENQSAILWSVAGSWNLHRESFLENTGVDQLKLRVSYGKTGNQDFTPENSGDFRSLTTYAATDYAGQAGLFPATVGDPGYKWEISNQLNIGVDFALFNSRLRGTVDVYNNITSDLFITQQLSRTSGFASRQVNAGTMRNRGVEFKLDYDLVRTEDWLVAVGGNITYNQNEITDLGQVDEFEQGTSIIRVGLPLGSHYIVEWAGVNPANGEPLYKDAEGNITNQFSADNSVAKFGTFEPPVYGGFNSEVRYKGFSFSTFWTFNYGYTIFNNQRFFQENHNFTQYNLSSIMNEMWKEPGDITDIQSFRYARQFSSKDLEDGSFLRLRNVVISYNFPQQLLDNVNTIKSARIFAQGQNLLTFTKFTGFDPENYNNIAQYEYPASRIYTVGVDVTF